MSSNFSDLNYHLARDVDLQKEVDESIKNLRYFSSAHAFKTLLSTNDHALSEEHLGAMSGTVIIASHQSAGRGRLKRVWHMQEGDIALSLILRPPHIPKTMALMSMMPALAVVDAASRFEIALKLKWPNDIIVEDAIWKEYFGNFSKVGGVLLENVFSDNQIRASIIGIGVNLTNNNDLRATIPHASSLAHQMPTIPRREFLKCLLEALEKRIHSMNSSFEIIEDYKRHCETIGRVVTLESPKGPLIGCARAINADGSLVISDGSNEHIVFAGDVNFSIRREIEQGDIKNIFKP